MTGDDGRGGTIPGAGREVNGSVPATLLRYLSRTFDEPTVVDVLTAAGLVHRRRAMSDQFGWVPTTDVVALAEAAVAVCGDPGVARRAGEELFRQHQRDGITDFVLSSGSMDRAAETVAIAATKMSTGRRVALAGAAERVVTLHATCNDHVSPHRFFCDYLAGYLESVPQLFGLEGTVTERHCQVDGDEACVFELAWTGDLSSRVEEEGAASRARSHRIVARFEELQRVAGELAQADDLATVLERITLLAGTAVHAPSYLVAVRPGEGEEVRAHWQGLTPEEADRVAARLVSEDLVREGHELIVDVASDSRWHGRLGAFFAPGSLVTQYDERFFAAYAAHAAVALERIATLEQARRDRDTARALLELSRALAEVRTSEDVALRLAQAIPDVVGCAHSWVWLLAPGSDHFTLAGTAAPPEALQGCDHQLRLGDLPYLTGLVTDPRPFFLDAENATGVARQHMTALGVERSAVVPMTVRGELFGLVSAGFTERTARPWHPDVVERLQGLASQAASALDNARLLDRVRHQALHDPLTGLPNRPLLEDRARQALLDGERRGVKTALIFVDLDRFKLVNDTLGHGAGDRLICQAADRMSAAIRGSDTLARLGGDEFVVLLPNVLDSEEPELVARKLIACLRVPFELQVRDVRVTCSIGIAMAPDHGSTYASLLNRADAAMYLAKVDGRDAYRMATEGHPGPWDKSPDPEG